jgi:hypothetical protein
VGIMFEKVGTSLYNLLQNATVRVNWLVTLCGKEMLCQLVKAFEKCAESNSNITKEMCYLHVK